MNFFYQIKTPDYIDEIAIDFTLHIHPYLLEKLFKFYQKSNRFLIIVVYGTVSGQELEDINNKIQEDPIVDYKEYVKVVSLNEFAEFFGMDTYKQGIYFDELQATESLANSAITSESDYNKLDLKYEKAKISLDTWKDTEDYGFLFDDSDRFLGKKP